MSMSELKSELKRPLDKANLGHDVAALNGLIGLLNNPEITGAVVPKGEDTRVAPTAAASPAAAPAELHELIPPVGEPTTPALKAVTSSSDRLVFTGRIGVGKDYCATHAGATIFGFADPLYYLVKFFFGIDVSAGKNKELPGVRSFLQMVGQWGRGTINEQYPLSPARAMFISAIRSLNSVNQIVGYAVDWQSFGKSEDIWLDACLRRTESANGRIAITNVRFANELARTKENHWRHWHVMTDKKTWAERLKQVGLTPESPQVRDTSERLADGMDADVVKKISAQKSGPKLRVIWNSPEPVPSARLYTLDEFLHATTTDASATPQTGE